MMVPRQHEGGPWRPNPLVPRDPRGLAPSTAVPSCTEWTADLPSVPGWYWLRHAVFQTALGQWHEPRPVVVELVPDATGHLLVYVSGTTWTRSVEDLLVGEWSGPLAIPR
jgi:hypothetical protein